MTYAVEFDRVHYPLPLIHEDSPNPEALKKTIRRLKQVGGIALVVVATFKPRNASLHSVPVSLTNHTY